MTFLADLRDLGAIEKVREKRHLDVVVSFAAAALGTVVPLYSPLERIFATVPAVARILHIGIPIVMFALAVHVIVHKEPRPTAAGFASGNTDEQVMYTYPSGRRWTAKLVLLPLSLLFGWEVFDKAPNTLFGRDVVRAFVHDPSGVPVANVTLALYDRFGNPVSAEATTDDTGFVFLFPEASGARPITWTAIGSCTTEHFPVRQRRRPASTRPSDTPRRRALSWMLPCRPK